MKTYMDLRWVRILPIMLLLAGVITGCGDVGEREDLKSPCVGSDDSPCGPKRSVNGWWVA